MSATTSTATKADLTLFPIEYRWDRPSRPWHAQYTPEIPPGIDVTPIRVEELLVIAAEKHPDRTAVIFAKTKWTYSRLLEQVKRTAAGLAAAGVKEGDRVLFVLPNCPEFILAWFACHWLGAEVVPANPLCSGEDLARYIEKTGAKVVLGLDVRLEPVIEMIRLVEVPKLFVVSLAPHLPLALHAAYRLRNFIYRPGEVDKRTTVRPFRELYARSTAGFEKPAVKDPERVAILQPTGGTTGKPKLAMLTHRNLIANLSQYYLFGNRPPAQDTVMAVLPFFHIYGTTVVMLGTIGHACTLVLQPRFDVKRYIAACDKYHPTIGPLVPFMYVAINEELARRKRKLRCFDICSSGSAPLEMSIRREFFENTGAHITEGYGLSETSPVVTSCFPGVVRDGTVGVPVPETDVKIVDIETGQRELAPGEVGELIVKGPQVMKGYLDDPTETAIALRDGWLYTGDLATMEPDGYFRIVDRKKDMVITGGLNVFPSEVEPVIQSFPGVANCAVVGEPDHKWGQRVIAWLVPQPGAQIIIADLEEHCRKKMAHYKIPREFRVVEALPVSFLGKVQRAQLRHAGGVGGPPYNVADKAAN